MYKLIIIDDKPNVIEGIQRFGDWTGHGVAVAGTAANGREALHLLARVRPDIAITDISMPLMDGLTFTAEALKINPRLKIIVLSGYDQFEYAQQAVRLGVMDYLLKPVKIDQIVAAVEKACERLRAEQQLETELNHLRDQQEQNASRQRLSALLERPQDWPSLSLSLTTQDQTALGLQLTAGDYRVVVFQPAELVKAAGKEALLVNQHGVRLIAPAGALPLAEQLVTADKDARVALSQVYRGLAGLGRAYQEALNLLRESAFKGPPPGGPILTVGPGPGAVARPAYPDRVVRELLVALKAGAEAQIARLVEDFLAALAEATEPGYVRASSLELLAVAAHSLNAAGVPVEPPASYASRLEQCEHLTSLRALISEVLTGYARQVEAQRTDRNKSAVEIAIEFIRANLHREISLDDVAAHIYFTPGYLAHLFKKATGETVVEYISRLKMERAAELVRHPDAKIAAIAQALGYSDRRYFSELFRRRYGCTPSEYKEKFLAGVPE